MTAETWAADGFLDIVLPRAAVAPFEPAENPATATLMGDAFRHFDGVSMADDATGVRFNAELPDVFAVFHGYPSSLLRMARALRLALTRSCAASCDSGSG